MIIQCQGCAAKYFLPEDKVPENPLKVRCPKCTAVFTLVPQLAPVGVAAPAPAAESPVPSAPPAVEHTLDPVPEPAKSTKSAKSAQPAQPVAEPVASAAAAAPPAPPAPKAQPAQPVAEPVAEPAAPPAVEQTPDPAPKPSKSTKSAKPAKSKRGGRSKEDRAKRLARVLVSDILCYNQDRRDQALEDGTLMTVLGEEIKKSWELYKEKVGPDLANSTNYFKEALNEILADGQEVF